MLNNLNETLSRWTVAVAGTGVAAGLLATSGRDAAAQDATPEVGVATPGDGSAALGYVSMRMRPYET